MLSKHYLTLILCLIEFTQLKSQDVVQNVKLDNKAVRCLGKSTTPEKVFLLSLQQQYKVMYRVTPLIYPVSQI